MSRGKRVQIQKGLSMLNKNKISYHLLNKTHNILPSILTCSLSLYSLPPRFDLHEIVRTNKNMLGPKRQSDNLSPPPPPSLTFSPLYLLPNLQPKQTNEAPLFSNRSNPKLQPTIHPILHPVLPIQYSITTTCCMYN